MDQKPPNPTFCRNSYVDPMIENMIEGTIQRIGRADAYKRHLWSPQYDSSDRETSPAADFITTSSDIFLTSYTSPDLRAGTDDPASALWVFVPQSWRKCGEVCDLGYDAITRAVRELNYFEAHPSAFERHVLSANAEKVRNFLDRIRTSEPLDYADFYRYYDGYSVRFTKPTDNPKNSPPRHGNVWPSEDVRNLTLHQPETHTEGKEGSNAMDDVD